VGGGRGEGPRLWAHGSAAATYRPKPRPGGVLELGKISGESRPKGYGYINRALPDAELDVFVDALATRIAADVELGTGWDACIASLGRPAARDAIKTLMARGFHKPGDVENRLGDESDMA
jgi:hypothetical protein